jgi:hypothetical protein
MGTVPIEGNREFASLVSDAETLLAASRNRGGGADGKSLLRHIRDYVDKKDTLAINELAAAVNHRAYTIVKGASASPIPLDDLLDSLGTALGLEAQPGGPVESPGKGGN